MKKHIIIIITILSIFSSNNIAQDVSLWGMVETSGLYDGGAVYKLDQDSDEITEIYQFNKSLKTPVGLLVKANNGMFYGYSIAGTHKRVIYRYDPILDTAIIEYRFEGGNSVGTGQLIKYNDELLMGHTSTHIFSYNIVLKEYIELASFADIGGVELTGKLLKSTNNKIYGQTISGGAYDKGIIFEFDFSSYTITKLFEFNGYLTGANPQGDMLEASNGKIYGVTSSGGSLGDGVLYEFNKETHQYNKRKEFGGNNYLLLPRGGPIEAANGVLYGWVDHYNYYPHYHCIYSYNLNSTEFKIEKYYDESLLDVVYRNGTNPSKTMIYNIFNEWDGAEYHWKILRFNPINNTDTIIDINLSTTYYQLSDFSIANDSSFYLSSRKGGTKNKGELFLYNFQTNTCESKYSFGTNNCGKKPIGSFFMRSNGKLYAETSEEGNFGFGILFEIDPSTGAFKKILDFEEENIFPIETLVEAENSRCFGVITYGEPDEFGFIYEFDFNDYSFNIVYEFNSSESLPDDGKYPLNLISYLDGKLYGTSMHGGGYDYGTIFKFNPESLEYAKIFDFESVYFGETPRPILKLDEDNIYIHCIDGGTNSHGVLEYFDPVNNTVIPKIYFDNSSFYSPNTPIIESTELGKACYFTKESYNNRYFCEYDIETEMFTRTLMIDHNGFSPIMSTNNGMIYGISGYSTNHLMKYDKNSNNLSEILTDDYSINFGYISGLPIEVCQSSQTNLNQANLPDIINECSVVMPTVPTAINDCGIEIPGVPSIEFPITTIGTTIITWTYTTLTDTLTQTQNIIVYDSIAPTASNPDTIIVVCEANFPDPNPAVVADAADNCLDQPIVEWLSDVSDNNTNPETITRTYSVSDEADNSITVDQIIIILDNEASTNVGILHTNQVNASEVFTSTIEIEDVFNLASFELEISFDTAMLQANSVTLESFLGSTGRTIFPVANTIDNDNGIIDFAVLTLGDTPPGPDGAGTLLSIEWTTTTNIINDTTTDIIIENYQFAQPDGTDICVTPENSSLNIIPCDPHDLDCDCDVDIVDVTTAAYHYGTQIGDDLYDPTYDLDNDGDIDIIDLTMITYYYGWTCGSKSSIYLNTNNDNVLLSFSPTEIVYLADGTFELELNVENIQQLGGYELEFDFDPQALQVLNVEQGSFLTSTYRKTFPVQNTINNNDGKINFAITTFGSDIKGASEAGALVKIRCKPLKSDFELPALTNAQIVRIDAAIIPYNFKDAENQVENDANTYIASTFPSPFKKEMTIKYQVGQAGNVSFIVFDSYGKLLKQTESIYLEAGKYDKTFSGEGLRDGVYIISLKHEGNTVSSKRIVIIE